GEYVVYYSGGYIEQEPEDDTYTFEIRKGRKHIWYVKKLSAILFKWALHFQEKLKGILVLHRIDSSKEDGSFERLINDNHLTPNLVPKLVEVDGTSYPVFFCQEGH
ncbi:uncharacterized protein LOC110444248, partial [Mizuhopecten yessoensis]|uniref:uncharacterized protein LOC110444248 n=1 Tax=Mizuhopecten yessoensis TaxID=6573 RepID=UPI000B45C511